MKKKLLIITLSLIFIALAIITINPFQTSLEDIDHIYIFNSDHTEIFFTDKSLEDFKDILAMLKGPKKADFDDTDMDYHILELRGEDKTIKYKVFADLAKEELYLVNSKSNKEYAVDWQLAKDYLSIDGLVILYPDYEPHTEVSFKDTKVGIAPSGADWNLLKANGDYYKNSYTSVASPEYFELDANDEIKLDFGRTPDLLSLEVFKGDQLIKTETIDNHNIIPIPHDGTLTYKLAVNYNEGVDQSYGTINYTFDVTMDLPPEVLIQDSTATPGGFFILKINNTEEGDEITLQQEIVEKVTLHNHGDDKVAIIPLDYWAETGSYPIGIYVNTQLIYEDTLIVEDRSFKVQHLIIDETIAANTRNEEASAEYAKYFTPSRYNSHPTQLWEGSFILPVEGRLTTEYGMKRTVNDELTSYRHSGLDIAAPTGTPIMASNTGKVVLSKNLIMTGETVVIDHGLGFFTVYFHLDRKDVMEGDMVNKGDIIGTVGSTGFSTGPHLHWTTSYYSSNIDPDILLEWKGLD
ncbi:M23 family metallopeptidase [Alkaliphilus serpentinus]|uniref:M23 family metallopeptidase n=1 Tax=Alkaliphilus serpentinus TaxID=1482731 RepID=A0A833HR36_9FIRM|nr:M23 family metallopeptidase [Alkaliphilus serpentinus]KAB3531536.1 M23 family metallopeptidase [Alkaliphilus serpentinus]